MKIYSPDFNNDPDFQDNNTFTRTGCSVSDGIATITRTLYFKADNISETAADILDLNVFPQKGSAHPKYPRFKYQGNAKIEPFSDKSLFWLAELEYVNGNIGSDGSSGDEDEDEDVAPWQLGPESVNITYPEVTVPLELAYNEDGEKTVPVQNSAGDMIPAETTVCNMRIEATFATRNWDEDNGIAYCNTINQSAIRVFGIRLPEKKAVIKSLNASYLTVYEDNSTNIKWRYWSVNVVIDVDISGTIIYQNKLNIGDRAKFDNLFLGDDPLLKEGNIETTFPGTTTPSQICKFRMTKKIGDNYLPLGDIVFCSWEQYLAIRQAYYAASSSLPSPYDMQCEQLTSMPLTASGYLLTEAIPGHQDYDGSKYESLPFLQYRPKSWNYLNLPEKGIKR